VERGEGQIWQFYETVTADCNITIIRIWPGAFCLKKNK